MVKYRIVIYCCLQTNVRERYFLVPDKVQGPRDHKEVQEHEQV